MSQPNTLGPVTGKPLSAKVAADADRLLLSGSVRVLEASAHRRFVMAEVRSSRKGQPSYTVSHGYVTPGWQCSCVAGRNGHDCKHVAAVAAVCFLEPTLSGPMSVVPDDVWAEAGD